MTGEPRWSEAEIRAAFASAPYGLGVKAWLSADDLIAALPGVCGNQPEAEVHQGAQSSGHEWQPSPGGGWNCGRLADDPKWPGQTCGVIWSDSRVHVQRGPGQPGEQDTTEGTP